MVGRALAFFLITATPRRPTGSPQAKSVLGMGDQTRERSDAFAVLVGSKALKLYEGVPHVQAASIISSLACFPNSYRDVGLEE